MYIACSSVCCLFLCGYLSISSLAVKPDGVQRGLIGKIIQRFEEKGFTLVAMKLIWPTKEQAEGHYDDLK